MHTLFNSNMVYNTGSISLPGWNNAKQNLYTEINKLVRYFREAREWLPNTNPLVKILTSDSTLLHANADYTIENARNRWLRDANLFGINTPVKKASYMPDNIAYPNNVREYVALDDSIPVGEELKLNWKSLEPIRVLDHPYADLNLSLPNGKFIGDPKGGGSVFLSINIPMLVLQYRLWIKYEAERQGIDPNPAVFLIRYPLTNIMNSHMDIVIRNRFKNFYNGIEPDDFKVIRQGGVVVNNTANFVDRSLRELVKVVSGKNLNFNEFNQLVPQLSYDNVSQSLILPDMSYTRTVRWVYDASRINWYTLMVTYNNDRRITKNNGELEYMRRRLRYMAQDKEFQEAVGLDSKSHYTLLMDLL